MQKNGICIVSPNIDLESRTKIVHIFIYTNKICQRSKFQRTNFAAQREQFAIYMIIPPKGQ